MIDAITREEMFLANLAGEDVKTPEPITRKEKLLKKIIEKIGESSGGNTGTSEVVLIPETTITDDDWIAGEGNYVQEIDFMFDLNKSYKVVWNGKEYRSTVTDVSDDSGAVYVIGNSPATIGTGDNGMPFVIMTGEADGVKGLIVADIDAMKTGEFSTTTFSIVTGDDTSKPLEFLFSLYDINNDGYTISHSYSELKTAFFEGRTIIAKYTLVGVTAQTTRLLYHRVDIGGNEDILISFGSGLRLRCKPDGTITIED